jgi:hypothetical protein
MMDKDGSVSKEIWKWLLITYNLEIKKGDLKWVEVIKFRGSY